MLESTQKIKFYNFAFSLIYDYAYAYDAWPRTHFPVPHRAHGDDVPPQRPQHVGEVEGLAVLVAAEPVRLRVALQPVSLALLLVQLPVVQVPPSHALGTVLLLRVVHQAREQDGRDEEEEHQDGEQREGVEDGAEHQLQRL